MDTAMFNGYDYFELKYQPTEREWGLQKRVQEGAQRRSSQLFPMGAYQERGVWVEGH